MLAVMGFDMPVALLKQLKATRMAEDWQKEVHLGDNPGPEISKWR